MTADTLPAPGKHVASRAGRGKRWVWFKRVLTVLFFLLVIGLLVTQARSVAWDEVGESLGNYRASTLLLAGVFAVCSHVLFSSFDLIGRVYTGHGLSKLKVWLVAAISYAFTLNLGALIGGIGFRYRLYSRFGLDNATITRVYGLSVTTNWLGYLILAGCAFLFGSLEIPANWKIGPIMLHVVGGILLLIAAGYLAACGFARRRTWTVRKQEVTLPSLRMALVQSAMSIANWSSMAGVIYLLLDQKVAFVAVLTALLASALAGVLTHVPAGLGVLEAVFIALLGDRMPQSALLAGLLAYRGIYYLIPLVLGTIAYAVTEARARKRRAS